VVNDTLLFNEIAPRPHNSAHATIEGYSLSQYDVHVAAITGSPVVHPHRLQWTYLENILGQDEPAWRTKALAIPQARIHLYGKQDIRPHRKLGHIVLSATSETELNDRIDHWRKA
jgi:phosphoribosylaminoimidazole carboxylase (NCAIR synthetase)